MKCDKPQGTILKQTTKTVVGNRNVLFIKEQVGN